MSPVKYSLAFFLGIFFQTLLVGLFIPLFVVASYVQWKRVSRGREINLVMAFTTAFFGLSIIAHWILGVRKVMVAGLYLPSGVTVDHYFMPPYSTDEIVRRGIFQVQITIADVIMVYRMYHIYEKSLLACAIPSITTAGLFAIGCGLTNQYRTLVTPADFKANDAWAAACFSVTLFNSFFTSAAISLRLWKAHRETLVSGATMGESVLLRALRVLIESAALLTLSVLLNFIAFLTKSNLRYTFLYMTGPVIGITFCLIIVRLGTTTVEIREDTWESSRHSRASRVLPFTDPQHSKAPIPLDRVKVERDVYISDTESGAMEFHMMDPTSSGEKRSPVH